MPFVNNMDFKLAACYSWYTGMKILLFFLIVIEAGADNCETDDCCGADRFPFAVRVCG